MGNFYQNFHVITFSPGYLSHPGLAVAGARAGATGILDIEFCNSLQLEQARLNINSLLDLVKPAQTIGLRLNVQQLPVCKDLLEILAQRPHWLILCGVTVKDLNRLRKYLLYSQKGKLLLEITEAEHLPEILESGLQIDGLIACGSESGGFTGEDSAFISAQKLLRSTNIPVYIRGGIGLHTAGACRAGGAAGVVLDDQLLLMPESPILPAWKRELENLSGQEPLLLGTRIGAGCRILVLPRLAAAKRIVEFEAELEASDDPRDKIADRWEQKVSSLMGWGSPEESAWPVGQAVMHANYFAKRYPTTGRFVQAVQRESGEHVRLAGKTDILGPGSGLAISHGSEYPIVQGPMAQVSDRPEFLNAVSESGALPFLALSTMRGEEAGRLLSAVKKAFQDRPWGVGFSGFLPAGLQKEQIEQIMKVKPPFALIAGGRPDQVSLFEGQGIPTYLHVPVPGLLEPFFKQGVRRFVFEGRECGGHVGPLGSFPLWESMISKLLEIVPAEYKDEIHVLFAGGIHDALSAAMVAAAAAPLYEQGMKVGIQMGTAYLCTKEVVESGALVKNFQDRVLSCEKTVTLEMGLGHANRCAPGPFADKFSVVRRDLLKEKIASDLMLEKLEGVCQGCLQIATKGIARTSDGDLSSASSKQQNQDGMFLMGQLSTMRTRVCSIRDFHKDVSLSGSEILQKASDSLKSSNPYTTSDRTPSNIAIIGISFLLPGASDMDTYWRNILRKKEVIREIPKEYWDMHLVYDPDQKKSDKSYSKWGGFIDEIVFNPLEYGIPPKYVGSISTMQLIMLEVVQRALRDAGYESNDADSENTAIIVSNADYGGFVGHQLMFRSYLPFFVEPPFDAVYDRLAGWNEESLTGVLPNIMAGRIANRLNLGGPNFVLDAACASSLTALDLGVRELESGRSNKVVVGCAEFGQNPFSYIGFSRIQALSATGHAKVFDKAADGIVLSEGVVAVILKRLADAERDGDKIYSVIKAVGGSSDGKAMALTAPLPKGQIRALKRAYTKAGFSPRTIGFYEAHGTGTPVGDKAEMETIVDFLNAQKTAPKACSIGAGKALMGHTKIAAGLVSLVKSVMSLSHCVLAPQGLLDNPLDPVSDPNSPVAMYKEAIPWLRSSEYPRRCGISSFGFGGTNSHAVLEEYTSSYRSCAPGGDPWPSELFVFQAKDRSRLRNKVAGLLDSLEKGAEPRLRDLAYTYARDFEDSKSERHFLGVVARDLVHLKSLIRLCLVHFDDPESLSLPPEIIRNKIRSDNAGRIAFLFPGQGAQYPNMGREVSLYFQEMRDVLERADSLLAKEYPKILHQYIFPPGPFSEEEKKSHEKDLQDSHVAQPSIVAISAGFMNVVTRLGLRPEMVCGHSLGEYSALYAADVLSLDQILALSEKRGKLMANACKHLGAMAAVRGARERVEALLSEFDGIVLANDNAPQQVVISGKEQSIQKIMERFREDGIYCSLLPVAGAFHSALMKGVQTPLSVAIASLDFKTPRIPVYSNMTAMPYPNDPEAVQSQLQGHLRHKVEFVKQIENMYHDGARIFVELGPKGILSGLVEQILAGREHITVTIDGYGGGIRGLLIMLGKLIVAGAAIDIRNLFDGRDVTQQNIQRLAETTCRPEPPDSAWIINGCNSRPKGMSAGYWGTTPPFTMETALVKESPRESAPSEQMMPFGQKSDAFHAYKRYQETMQQFLALQEKVVHGFLGGSIPNEDALKVAQPFFSDKEAFRVAPQEPIQPLREEATDDVPEEAIPEGATKDDRDLKKEAGILSNKAFLLDKLQRMISERTGYPTDMLGPDMDMESELGIDSIKRMEILESFLGMLPELDARVLRERMDELTRVRTLNTLADMLCPDVYNSDAEESDFKESVPLKTERDDSPVRVQSHHTDSGKPRMSEDQVCPRYIMHALPGVLPKFDFSTYKGLFLITEDSLSVAQLVGETLLKHGAQAEILPQTALTSQEEIKNRVLQARKKHGSHVRGLIHLAPLSVLDMPTSIEDWKYCTQRDVKSLFQLMQICSDDLQADDFRMGRVIAASLMGGFFGRNGQVGPGLPSGGGCQGLIKTLYLEWPRVHPKAIDIDNKLKPSEIAEIIVNETLLPGGEVEVGYPKGKRTVFTVSSMPVDSTNGENKLIPEKDWVVLATGGARGITSLITRSLIVPGMRLIVVGKSPEVQTEPPEISTLQSASALRRHLVEQNIREKLSKTPAQIEANLNKILQNRDRLSNVSSFSEAGAFVEYHAVDVMDEQEFGKLIQDIYSKYGRLDAVIHGAGIISDKLIVEKDFDSFDRVFDTKADSTFVLAKHLQPDSLKLFIFFSSTAGRFGNRGQSDYSAANEVINRFAWWMRKQWPNVKVRSINWGPWDHPGMASDKINKRFVEMGIVPIQPETGCRFFMDEIHFSDGGPSEVIAGKGPWDSGVQEVINPFSDLDILLSDTSRLYQHYVSNGQK